MCSAGLGTVSEILDWDNGWDMLTLQTMIPVAVEIEARRAQVHHTATTAAVAAAFDPKAGKAFADATRNVLEGVRREQRGREAPIPKKGRPVVATAQQDRFLAALRRAAAADRK